MLSYSRLTKLEKKETFLDGVIKLIEDVFVSLSLFSVGAAHLIVEYR